MAYRHDVPCPFMGQDEHDFILLFSQLAPAAYARPDRHRPAANGAPLMDSEPTATVGPTTAAPTMFKNPLITSLSGLGDAADAQPPVQTRLARRRHSGGAMTRPVSRVSRTGIEPQLTKNPVDGLWICSSILACSGASSSTFLTRFPVLELLWNFPATSA